MRKSMALVVVALSVASACDISGLRSSPPLPRVEPEPDASVDPGQPRETDAGADAGRAWTVERVDAGTLVVGTVSITATRSGTYVAHPSFESGLNITRFDQGDPSTEILPTPDTNLGYTSLHHGADGEPVLAFLTIPIAGWNVTRRAGGHWEKALSGNPFIRVSGSVALRVGPHGAPSLVVRDELRAAVSLLRWNGTAWDRHEIPDFYSDFASLDLDAENRAHVSHFSLYSNQLLYSTFDGARWVTEPLLKTPNPLVFSSLRVDSQGKPHVCFLKDAGAIIHAVREPNGWTFEELPFMAAELGHGSFELDSKDQPHLVFGEYGGLSIVHAAKRDGQWKAEQVGARTTSYSPPALSLDAQDQPHIAWTDKPHSLLLYAH